MRRYHLFVIILLLMALSVPLTLRAQQATPTPNIVYVQPGDSLARIAQRYGTTVSAILAVNPDITNPDLVYVGQAITLPSPSAIVPTTAVGTPVAAPLPAEGSTLSATLIPPPDAAALPFALGGQVFSFARPDAMRDAGMTWARAQVRWNLGDSIDAARGAIDAARQNGFSVLLNIIGNPAQLAGDPTTYYQRFAAYLAEVASLAPDAIEVWRAPNTPREWLPGLISPAAYTQLLTAAYNAIKSVNPEILVVSAALSVTTTYDGCTETGCDDAPFIAGMAAAGADQVADCIGVAYTQGAVPPRAAAGDTRAPFYGWYFIPTLNQYAQTFPNKPLCLTEIGYLSGESYDPLPTGYAWAVDTSADDQAAWLAQAAALARESGRVRLFVVWNIDSTLYGSDPLAGWAIVRPDGSCPACTNLAQ